MTVTAPARDQALDARALRHALGTFPTGVVFVTAAPEGVPAGLVVNSFASVSLEPPLVSFCPSRGSYTWSRMRRADRIGINVLASEHEDFAIRAAPAGADRFANVGWEAGDGGAPLLTGALATLECELVAEHPAGDHWIAVACVNRLRVSLESDPLVFFAGAFTALRSPNGRRTPRVPLSERP